ncbi:Ficolin-1 [Apostichopus japonicus]|uniref:Ficolin-1 n=2 Tax=Stichopus japonicus TaxID=307972 RepID=A0A2G8L651_STIJA|nr:Ficolin-1 [Apostichopus japonicus]
MTDGGGWTVFQRRVSGSQDFFLYWNDYKVGFGDLNENFWLGNEKIYSITNQGTYELRIDFIDANGRPLYAKYDNFRIRAETENYKLVIGNYAEGDAGDSLSFHNNGDFVARETSGTWDGPWWHRADFYKCSLNGPITSYNSFYWQAIPSYHVHWTEMKVRALS